MEISYSSLSSSALMRSSIFKSIKLFSFLFVIVVGFIFAKFLQEYFSDCLIFELLVSKFSWFELLRCLLWDLPSVCRLKASGWVRFLAEWRTIKGTRWLFGTFFALKVGFTSQSELWVGAIFSFFFLVLEELNLNGLGTVGGFLFVFLVLLMEESLEEIPKFLDVVSHIEYAFLSILLDGLKRSAFDFSEALRTKIYIISKITKIFYVIIFNNKAISFSFLFNFCWLF